MGWMLPIVCIAKRVRWQRAQANPADLRKGKFLAHRSSVVHLVVDELGRCDSRNPISIGHLAHRSELWRHRFFNHSSPCPRFSASRHAASPSGGMRRVSYFRTRGSRTRPSRNPNSSQKEGRCATRNLPKLDMLEVENHRYSEFHPLIGRTCQNPSRTNFPRAFPLSIKVCALIRFAALISGSVRSKLNPPTS